MAYIYVLECVGGVIKIGVTNNPERRISQYRSEKNPKNFRVDREKQFDCVWKCHGQYYKCIEQMAINSLSQRFMRIRNEGFLCPVFEAVEAIMKSAQLVDIPLNRHDAKYDPWDGPRADKVPNEIHPLAGFLERIRKSVFTNGEDNDGRYRSLTIATPRWRGVIHQHELNIPETFGAGHSIVPCQWDTDELVLISKPAQ